MQRCVFCKEDLLAQNSFHMHLSRDSLINNLCDKTKQFNYLAHCTTISFLGLSIFPGGRWC